MCKTGESESEEQADDGDGDGGGGGGGGWSCLSGRQEDWRLVSCAPFNGTVGCVSRCSGSDDDDDDGSHRRHQRQDQLQLRGLSLVTGDRLLRSPAAAVPVFAAACALLPSRVRWRALTKHIALGASRIAARGRCTHTKGQTNGRTDHLRAKSSDESLTALLCSFGGGEFER